MNLLSASLPNRFISISGADAVKFLQGQASCDLSVLTEKHFSFGTLNTPKGRMYCLFKIIKTEHGLLLSMNESLLETTLQKLSKYAVFFKCELKEEVAYRAVGFTSIEANNYPALLNNIGLNSEALSAFTKSDGTFYLNISDQNRLGEIWLKDGESLPKPFDNTSIMSLEHWFALETRSGVPELYSSSQEAFILQYLNLHHLDAVSFKKGCYTGQEIIARMKFLGKQKKQTYLLHSDQQSTPAPLSPVYDNEGKKCGVLVRSHYSKETGTCALAILPIDSALHHNAVFIDEALHWPFSVSEIDYSEFKK
tara:strand:- start:11812 stop:12738 length:927 start_codon:yes stop_codon:yes gene_type:complete